MKKYIFDYARKAKSISYGSLRNKSEIIGIVIHYTGNAGDTLKTTRIFLPPEIQGVQARIVLLMGKVFRLDPYR